jgi:hypothetical protein
VAGAHASENKEGGKPVGRVATFDATKAREEGRVADLTNAEDQKKVFGERGGGTAANFAKASQEVLIKGGVGPEDVTKVEDARKPSVKEYNQIKTQMEKGETATYDGQTVNDAFRTRTKAGGKPDPRLLLEQKKDEDSK